VNKKVRPNKVVVAKGKAPSVKVLPKTAGKSAAAAKPVRPAGPPPLRKSPLSKAELDEFHQMLMDKRRAILGDMTGMEAETVRSNRQDRSGDLSNIPIHPADVGTDNFEQEFTLGLLESERTLLREIDEALERIKAVTYGVCQGTGKPIDKARLRARPWTKYCIEYARLIEKGLAPRQDAGRPAGEEQGEQESEPEAEAEVEADAEPETEPAEEEPFEEETEE
jgi:RNA polymerase-binding protein DksA